MVASTSSGLGDLLRLDVRPGEAIGPAWVRRQFVFNGLVGSPTTADQVVSLVVLINQAFNRSGYINTGLLFSAQDWPKPGGVLRLRLIQGVVVPAGAGQPAGTVLWANGRQRGLRKSYIIDRMTSAGGVPLNTLDVERDFRLLAEDPAIRTINARIDPGEQAGQARLTLTVMPQPRLDVYATVANSRSPSVGGIRYSGGATLRNALFSGDLVTIDVGETQGLADGVVTYSTPVLDPATTFDLRALVDHAAVVDQAVRDLGIRSTETSIEGGLSRRLFQRPLRPTADGAGWSPAQSLTVGLRVAARYSQSSLLGMPFSFSPGAVNGISKVNVARAAANYLLRGEKQVLAVSGAVSYGLSGTGSDVPGVVKPDPHFRVVLLQVNYARRLTAAGLEFRVRLAGQQSTSPLYSAEQFSAGGQDTVRGYRENLVLADSGVVGSLELGCPMAFGQPICAARYTNWKSVRLSAFTDAAYMRNRTGDQPTPEELSSVGLGLGWTPSDALSVRVSYARALVGAPRSGSKDLQDDGFQFNVTLHPTARTRFYH
jgi:hemolysin activation/secretion protein